MRHLLLLHGAIGSSAQLSAVADALAGRYHVHTLDFPGHGGKPFPEQPFSIPFFAQSVLDLMNERELHKVCLFGYSMGGYVGAYLAGKHPERIEKLVTLGTKFHWDETIATKEVQMLNAEKIEQKVPAFAETLKKLHSPNDWKEVLSRTADMMNRLGKENALLPADYAAISTPSLLMLGDRDKMVTLDETVAVYKSMPYGRMCVLPNTPHPIEQVDNQLLAFMAANFLG